jgi:AcrR family transcriptional regulator
VHSTQHLIAALPDTDDLDGDLRIFAREHIREVVRPDLVRMRRIVIAEADRFPGLARAWYDNAPGRAAATLADCFSKLADRGLLHMDDPLLAAQQFNWLVLSIPLNRAMFYGEEEGFTPDELDRYADEAVRVFLAAHRPP